MELEGVPPFSAAFRARYEIRGRLGQGGMGTVFRAWQCALDREVALKVLNVGDADLVARFLREGRVMGGLRHPAIVAVHDAGLDGAIPFLVCELIDGETLDVRVARQAPTCAEALGWVAEIASALAVAHEHGVLHRDVKPANAFCTARGEVKLGDFGLAREVDQGSTLTAGGMLLGTPAYMAPEQVRGERPTRAVDVYQLGVMAFELVVGVLPFRGDSAVEVAAARLHGQPPRPRALRPELPEEVERFLLALLDPDTAARPDAATVVETARRLAEKLEGGGEPKRAPGAEAPRGAASRRLTVTIRDAAASRSRVATESFAGGRTVEEARGPMRRAAAVGAFVLLGAVGFFALRDRTGPRPVPSGGGPVASPSAPAVRPLPSPAPPAVRDDTTGWSMTGEREPDVGPPPPWPSEAPAAKLRARSARENPWTEVLGRASPRPPRPRGAELVQRLQAALTTQPDELVEAVFADVEVAGAPKDELRRNRIAERMADKVAQVIASATPNPLTADGGVTPAEFEEMLETAKTAFPLMLEERRRWTVVRRHVIGAVSRLRALEYALYPDLPPAERRARKLFNGEGRARARGTVSNARTLAELGFLRPAGAVRLAGWDDPGCDPGGRTLRLNPLTEHDPPYQELVLVVEAHLEPGEVGWVRLDNGGLVTQLALLPGEGLKRRPGDPYELYIFDLDDAMLVRQASGQRVTVTIRALDGRPPPDGPRCRFQDVSVFGGWGDPAWFPRVDPALTTRDAAGRWVWHALDRRTTGVLVLGERGGQLQGTLDTGDGAPPEPVTGRVTAGRLTLARREAPGQPERWQGWYGSLYRDAAKRSMFRALVLGDDLGLRTNEVVAWRDETGSPPARSPADEDDATIVLVAQAESALLQAVSSERLHAGFTGTGYVANWGHVDQAVRFGLPLAPGAYRAFVRYSAGSGGYRRVRVAGQPPFDLPFAATGGWGRWKVLEFPLVARTPITTVTFEIPPRVPKRPAGLMNMDRIVIRPPANGSTSR